LFVGTMISNGPGSYLFIRITIFCLRSITPLCIGYTVARITTLKTSLIPFPLEIIAYAESAFYFFVYLPRRHVLQRPALQGTEMSQQDRKELFHKCMESIPDMDYFLSVWFKGANTKDLKRHDVREWLAWAFFNQGQSGDCNIQELEEYVTKVEVALERPLPPGQGLLKAMRPTIDPINMQHRSLLYYLVSSAAIGRSFASQYIYLFEN
jgi:hypothetical protein